MRARAASSRPSAEGALEAAAGKLARSRAISREAAGNLARSRTDAPWPGAQPDPIPNLTLPWPGGQARLVGTEALRVRVSSPSPAPSPAP